MEVMVRNTRTPDSSIQCEQIQSMDDVVVMVVVEVVKMKFSKVNIPWSLVESVEDYDIS
jgi:hypothetical protein